MNHTRENQVFYDGRLTRPYTERGILHIWAGIMSVTFSSMSLTLAPILGSRERLRRAPSPTPRAGPPLSLTSLTAGSLENPCLCRPHSSLL